MSAPKKVLIVGGGGHAQVVIDLLRPLTEFSIIGVVEHSRDVRKRSLLGVPVLGSDDLLAKIYADGARHAIVALGDNQLRMRLAQHLVLMGFELVNALHPRSFVSEAAKLGKGAVVLAGAVVNAGSVIGDNVILNTLSSVDHDCIIGDAVHIAPGAHLGGGVQIGSASLIGLGSSIIPSIRIGENVVVGAGSVVVHDVPPNLTVAGVPARQLGKRNSEN